MTGGNNYAVRIDDCIQIAGARDLGIETARLMACHRVKGFPVKGDDVASFVVRLMVPVGQQAIQNLTIDTPLLNADVRVASQAI